VSRETGGSGGRRGGARRARPDPATPARPPAPPGMPTPELVALLRARARRQGAQTSRHRGVSLLRQTGRWHAQINVAGRQVHLGFFGREDAAARAYDRAAILKGAAEAGSKIVTNYGVADYEAEIPLLASVPPASLVAALTDDGTRKAAMALLCDGFGEARVVALFGARPAGARRVAAADLAPRCERAPPKHTSLRGPGVGGLGGLLSATRAATPDRGRAPPSAPKSPASPARPPRPPTTPRAAPALVGAWEDGPEARVALAPRATTARQTAVAARRGVVADMPASPVLPSTPARGGAPPAPPATPAVAPAPRAPRSPAGGAPEEEARRKRRKGAPTRAAV